MTEQKALVYATEQTRKPGVVRPETDPGGELDQKAHLVRRPSYGTARPYVPGGQSGMSVRGVGRC